MDESGEIELLRAERDLYRQLLDLGAHDDVRPFLDDALTLVVNATGAQRGYLAVSATPGAALHTDAPPDAWIAHGVDDEGVREIRREISTGIVAEAIRTGRTIATASAVADPRFRELKSVQAQRIAAVLCAPIGGAVPVGVLYLQGRAQPGPFAERDRALTETFASRIAPAVDRMLRSAQSNARTDPTLPYREKLSVASVVGRSAALAEMFRQMAVAAGVDANVLLSGESGTGKTEVARALHASSRRAAGAFVEINCAALPESLFEAELFGAEKGAHSTATRRAPGKIAAAEGGTLFLDEIAEIPLAAQAKLLQFLQSKRYFMLGSDRPIESNVRVVAASNVDLPEAVREKRFREDLFYRLNVLTLRVPSLRERTDDVPAIASYVAAGLAESHGRAMSLTFDAEKALSHTPWPGNVRELASAVQRGAAFALSEGRSVIDVRDLFPDNASAHTTDATPETWQNASRRFQREFLQQALDAAGGNVSEVARRLDLSRSHLHELLRAHGLGRTREP